MELNKIFAPKGSLYVSEFMDKFPNGILNKKSCGVGNTHLAITNPEPYIIAVPTVELIQNKVAQHKNLIGVYGSMTYSQFEFLLSEKPKPTKIMVTYNSLPKVVEWLNQDCYKTFNLMIDEYHSLLQDYSWKDVVINNLLECSLKFDHKCFVSATPINPKYTPKELAELPQWEIEWTDTTRIKPFRHKTNKPFQAVINIINKYKSANYELAVNIEGKILKSKEALFFVNSVKAIKDIIDNANLTQKEVKIICADNPRNKEILDGFKIDKVLDENKPFTFITQKSFLGSDFYSDSAITYVVSSVAKTNTLYSISSDVFQIAGRIRTPTNPFRNYIYHIYNTGASDLSREEFENIVAQKKDYTLTQISAFNKLNDHEKEAFKKRMSLDLEDDYIYYNHKTNQLEYNEFRELNEEFKFNIIYETYKNGLSIRDAYIKAGFDVTKSQIYTNEAENFIEKATSLNFKTIMVEYCNLIDCRNSHNCYPNEERIKQLEILLPEIKDIVNLIGTSKIRTLNYSQKAINQFQYNISDEVNKVIKLTLETMFKKGIVYESSVVKQELQLLYQTLKISKKAKATDLENYFVIDKKKRFIKNKVTDSIIIL